MNRITKTFTYNNKRYYVYGATESEVIRKMLEKKKALEQGKIKESNITLNEWAYKAVNAYKTKQSDITRQKYLYRLNHCILSELGYKSIKDITPLECQLIMNKQANKSRTQVNEVYQMFKFIFNKALENKLINNNPVEYLQKPKYYTTKRREITAEEKEALLRACAKNPRFDIFLFMLYCGLRPSEAINITGDDISELEGAQILRFSSGS